MKSRFWAGYRSRSAFWPIVAVAWAALVAGRVNVLGGQGISASETIMHRPECGGHDTLNIPLSGPIANVPEFHDCQRFIRDGGYIARFAIFVAYNLDSIVRSLAPDTLRRCMDARLILPGAGVRGMVRDTTAPRARAIDRAQAQGRAQRLEGAACPQDPVTQAVAVETRGAAITTIYNSGSVTYDPLGLRPGFSCLYLARNLATGGWRAKVVSNGPQPTCRPAVPDIDVVAGKELEVRATSPVGYRDNAYPPVARWDWDPVAYEQYIGIKCLAAWCEIGDPGFTPSASHSMTAEWPPWDPVPGNPLTVLDATRVLRVKGWYDEERLSVPSPDGALHPASVWGVLLPHPGLAGLDTNHFQGTWLHVANAVLEGTAPPYGSAKLNWSEGTNRIYLCSGSNSTECGILENWTDPRPDPAVGPPICTLSEDGKRWWALIISADPRVPPEVRCVYRRVHTGGFTMPAATRWRWKEDDTTVWVRCASGCCDLQ